MASRFSGKTYGRKGNSSKQNSAFDDMVKNNAKQGTSKASSSQQKWSKPSFTSARTIVESDARKRPANDDSLFSNPFDFDSDDEGPSKPKRGTCTRLKRMLFFVIYLCLKVGTIVNFVLNVSLM